MKQPLSLCAGTCDSTPRGTYDSTLRCKDRDMLFLRLRTWMFVHRLSESAVHIGTLQLVQATTPTGGYTAPWLRKLPQGWTEEAGCTALARRSWEGRQVVQHFLRTPIYFRRPFLRAASRAICRVRTAIRSARAASQSSQRQSDGIAEEIDRVKSQ